MNSDSAASQRSSWALLVGPLAGMPGGGVVGEISPWPSWGAPPSLVIAIDGGYAACRARGWEPQVVVGDFDSLTARDLSEIESRSIEVVRWSTDKDFSDLDGALDEAVRRGAKQITVIGVFGGRLDHQLAVIGSLSKRRNVPIVALGPTSDAGQACDSDRLSVLHEGEVASVPPGRTFSVMAIGGAATVSISGARWPLTRATLQPLSSVGLSNEALDEGSEVACTAGTVVVVIPCQ